MANEKDFREPDGATQDYELDEAFELAFEIDAFLRAYSLEYKTKFPMEQRQREILADKMLESDTFYIKHLISSVLGHEGDALMKRLNAYETEFRKNQYSVYHLKLDYDQKCEYSLKSERKKGNYINKDMYEIAYAEPLEQYKTPMGIDIGLMVNRAAGAAVYQPDLRDIIVINYDGEQKAYFKELNKYTEAPEFTGVHIQTAALSNYKGLTAFVGKDGNVYLGKSERNLYNPEKKSLPFYNNSDNSLTFISDNEKMFSFLCGSGWVLSQSEMIENGAFTKSDYQEFAELQKGILSKLEPIREITFKGKSFCYPDYDRNIEQTTEKQVTEKGVLKNMNDYKFVAFIVNRSEYDNGNRETSGTELYFPTDAETIKRTFEKIGLPENASPDTYFFDDYACGNEDLKKCLTMYESVDALNYLAMRISELEDTEMTVFQTALEAGECKNITDAINLTYNTECYEVLPDIYDYDDLGRNLLLEQDIVLGELCGYFDLEAYAMETEHEEGGKLLNGVYLRSGCAEYNKVYDGKSENIPPEYKVTNNIETAKNAEKKQKYNQRSSQINNKQAKPHKIPGIHIQSNNGIVNFGASSTNIIVRSNSQQVSTSTRINGNITEKPSIKAALDTLKKEQNGKYKSQQPKQKKPPEETL